MLRCVDLYQEINDVDNVSKLLAARLPTTALLFSVARVLRTLAALMPKPVGLRCHA